MRTALWATWILTSLLPCLCIWYSLATVFLGVLDPYGKVYFPSWLTFGAAGMAILFLHLFILTRRARPLVLAVAIVALLVCLLSMRWVFAENGRVEERWAGILLRESTIERSPAYGDYGSCYRVGWFTFDARNLDGGTYRYYQLWPLAFTREQWSKGFPLRPAVERKGEWQCVPVPATLAPARNPR